MNPKALEREIAYFRAIVHDLIAKGHQGKWACIVDEELVGTYDSPAQAFEAGVAKAGTTRSFLVEEVLEHERPPQVSTFSMGLISGDP